MMSSSVRSNRFPFTVSQWQELEHQALVFKYIVSGIPIPPDLLFTIRTSLDSSLSSKLLIHQPQHIGWNSFHMGFGRKIDPEPGRCRRTDGKKWRCSKEAYPDSKYCERHMHRGRNRSRKPVEIPILSPSPTTPTPTPTPPPNPIPTTSPITNRLNTPSTYLPSEPHYLYPHFSSSRPPPALALSSRESSNFFLDSHLHNRPQGQDCRINSSYGHGMKGGSNEHSFFTEGDSSSGIIMSGVNDSSSKLTLMANPSHAQFIKHHPYSSDLLKIQTFDEQTNYRQHKPDHDHRYNHRYYSGDHDNNDQLQSNSERDEQSKKVMHHFLDEWPPRDKDSWTSSEDKMPTHRTQLSISIPNSLHDFFVTQK